MSTNEKDENGRYIGYWEDDKLPIKQGDIVKIPKGTFIHTTHPRKENGPIKRTITVKVNHLLPGCNHIDRKSNPSVSWAGSAGYWMRADINDVILVEKS